MMTPLTFLLVALPALALAQASTNSPLQNGAALQYDTPKPPDSEMSARATSRPVRIGTSPALPERELRSWTVALKPAPPLKLGEGGIMLSGPLVDTFRLQRQEPVVRSLGRTILDLPILNLFVPQPMPRPTRQGPYLAWGERDLPWSVVCDRHHDELRGVWLAVH